MKNIVHRSRFKKIQIRKGADKSESSANTTKISTEKLIPISPASSNDEYLNICSRTKGERIQYLRRRNNYTLDEAAEVTKISRPELSRLEKDQRNLTEFHLKQIAAGYRVSLSELENILSYEVKSSVRLFSTNTSKLAPPEGRQISFSAVSELLSKKSRKVKSLRRISIPDEFNVSTSAYALEVDLLDHSFLIPDSLIIVDPEARVRLGDLVLNHVSWDPVIIRIERNSDGQLVGINNNQEYRLSAAHDIRSFHKVAAIFPGSQIWEKFQISLLS